MARSDERALSRVGFDIDGQCVTVERLRDLLASCGYHVVSDAQMRVLEAMAELTSEALQYWRVHGSVYQSNVAVAELARREGER